MSTLRPLQANLIFDTDAPVDTGSHSRLTEWAPEHWSVAEDWRFVVDRFVSSDVSRRLGAFMRERLALGAIVYPPKPLRALELTPLSKVKVVILGQDPYHGPGQAEGLAFSVAPGVRPPPSLKNIFKEIAQDPLLAHGMTPPPVNGSLVRWAQQGVLLLNTCLTVEEGAPASHARRGWEALTDDIVQAVARRDGPIVFLLWGAHAQAKQSLIMDAGGLGRSKNEEHLVLTANHPSPLSAMRPPKPFVGCGHFGMANAFLCQHQKSPIAW